MHSWSRNTWHLLVACLALASPLAGAADYWEATGGHVVVIATDGARRAQDLAGDFVRLEQAYRKLTRHAGTDVPATLLVFALANNDERRYLLSKADLRRGAEAADVHMNRFFPLPLGGVMAFGGHRGYAAPLQSAYAQYASYLVDAGATRAHPLWYCRGLAALFSDVTVASTTNRVILGGDHVVLPYAQTGVDLMRRFSLEELLTSLPDASWEDRRAKMYTWQSYVLLHYSLIGRPERRVMLERYASARMNGDDHQTARATAFGADWTTVEREYRNKLSSGGGRGKLTIDVAGPAAVPGVRALSEAETRTRLEQLRRIVDHFEAVAP